MTEPSLTERMTEPSLTERLAAWLVGRREAGLPASVLDTARTYVVDWLGSLLAGTKSVPGGMLLAHAASRSGGPCSVAGLAVDCSPELAALTNGGLSHIVEMDDLHRFSVVHPAAVVIPASLAVAEAEGATGDAFLASVVAGYEVAIRVGEAVGPTHYRHFHNTATCGGFGAAAAAGWLMGLGRDELVWALGNAGTQASGFWEFNADGAMSKHLHAGRAASNGVLAAALAAHGFTGARRILEGERGLFAGMAPDATPERVVENLDSPELKIGGTSLKPHASCRHTHAPVDAALELRAQLGDNGVEAIESVQVDTYQAALDLCDRPDPQTPYEASFSLQYCVASAVLRGSVGLAEFMPPSVAQADVRRLLAAVECRVEPQVEAAYPEQWRSRVQLRLAGGTTLEAEVHAPRGDPENPLSAAEVEAKFRRLAEHADRDGEADQWLAWVRSLGAGPLGTNRLPWAAR